MERILKKSVNLVDNIVLLYYHGGMELKKDLKPLDIKIDSRSALPVYEQVKQAIKLSIVSGYLEEGDRMIPIRELASNLKVNANTIVKVYYQLDVEGYLYSQPGSGYFVRGDRPVRKDEAEKILTQLMDEFVSKIARLGFSIEETIQRLEKRTLEPQSPGE